MTLQTAIAEYVDHVRHERRLAKTTTKQYVSWFHTFLEWLDANGYGSDPELDAFNTLVLRRYQMYKAKGGARPRTILSAFHPLRGLGQYLVTQGRLTENPCKALTMPKKDASIRHTLTDSHVTALFDACQRQRTPRLIALTRALMSILAYGGLRREEACCLRLDDVTFEKDAKGREQTGILVRSGKGGKSRRIFVCSEAGNALREWLAVREKDCIGDWLLMQDRARRVHFKGIASLMATLAATAGMADNPAAKPHSLRHWCLTNLVKNGAGLRDVMQFSGHSDLATLQRYLHSGEEELKTIAELTALRTPSQPQTPQKQEDDHKILRLSIRDRDAGRRLRRAAR
ncbi:MAG TPA: tyrosine-type recombinase/integrase [Chthonomonadaceae bacterium]|nr:tyrosine-type recombinase/integrase [Chthonomonadaceae bacterium]